LELIQNNIEYAEFAPDEILFVMIRRPKMIIFNIENSRFEQFTLSNNIRKTLRSQVFSNIPNCMFVWLSVVLLPTFSLTLLRSGQANLNLQKIAQKKISFLFKITKIDNVNNNISIFTSNTGLIPESILTGHLHKIDKSKISIDGTILVSVSIQENIIKIWTKINNNSWSFINRQIVGPNNIFRPIIQLKLFDILISNDNSFIVVVFNKYMKIFVKKSDGSYSEDSESTFFYENEKCSLYEQTQNVFLYNDSTLIVSFSRKSNKIQIYHKDEYNKLNLEELDLSLYNINHQSSKFDFKKFTKNNEIKYLNKNFYNLLK
jgi:hypothetical protein